MTATAVKASPFQSLSGAERRRRWQAAPTLLIRSTFGFGFVFGRKYHLNFARHSVLAEFAESEIFTFGRSLLVGHRSYICLLYTSDAADE